MLMAVTYQSLVFIGRFMIAAADDDPPPGCIEVSVGILHFARAQVGETALSGLQTTI